MVGVMSHVFGGTRLGASFWDACLFLALNGLQLALVFAIFVRERRQRHAQKRDGSGSYDHKTGKE
jgi:hypothetical protein